jgi:hypothetical protein
MKKADPFNMFHQHFHSMLEGAEHCWTKCLYYATSTPRGMGLEKYYWNFRDHVEHLSWGQWSMQSSFCMHQRPLHKLPVCWCFMVVQNWQSFSKATSCRAPSFLSVLKVMYQLDTYNGYYQQ